MCRTGEAIYDALIGKRGVQVRSLNRKTRNRRQQVVETCAAFIGLRIERRTLKRRTRVKSGDGEAVCSPHVEIETWASPAIVNRLQISRRWSDKRIECPFSERISGLPLKKISGPPKHGTAEELAVKRARESI